MAIISEAFEPFLAESGPNDRREAIVIYKTPQSASELRKWRKKRRMNVAQERRYLRDLTNIQAPTQLASLQRYRTAGKTRLPKKDKRDLETSTAGSMEGSMPFA